MLRIAGTALLGFGFIMLQQQMKINIDKSKHYSGLLEQANKQLQLAHTQNISKNDLKQAGPQKILKEFKKDLKKKTVQSLQLVSKLKKQDYRIHHIITGSILGCGLAISPYVFMFAVGGYCALYQYYYFDRILKFRFGVQVPLSYNFESVHYLYTIGCGILLAIGGTIRVMHRIYEINAPKYLTIKKE